MCDGCSSVVWCGLGYLLGRGGSALCDGCSMVWARLSIRWGGLCAMVGARLSLRQGQVCCVYRLGAEVGMVGSIGAQWARGEG